MDQAIWLGYGVLVGLCWVLGLRALGTALRRQGVLEWGLASVLLGTGAVGCPLTFLPSVVELSLPVRAQVLAGGMAGLGVGSIGLYVTTWRFFRQRSVAAALVCTAGTFVIAWSFVAELLTESFSWGRDRFWLVIGGAACWLPYLWGALEIFSHARERLRAAQDARQRDAARIFLLYGVAEVAVAVVFPFGIASIYLSHGLELPRPVVVAVVCGAVAAALPALRASQRAERRAREGAGPR